MNRFLAGLSGLILLAGSAAAADAQGRYFIQGESGAMKCSAALQASESAGRDYGNWLAGYVSALNRTTPDTYNIIGGVTLDALLQSIMQFCTANPDEMLEAASWDALQKVYDSRLKTPPATP